VQKGTASPQTCALCPSGHCQDPTPCLGRAAFRALLLLTWPRPWFWALKEAPHGQPTPETRCTTNPAQQCWDVRPHGFHAHNHVLAHSQRCTQGCSSHLPSHVQAGRWDQAPFSNLLQASSKPKDIKQPSSPTWSGSGTSPHHSPSPTSPWDDESEQSTLVFLSLKVDQKSEHCHSRAQGAVGQREAPPNAYSSPILSPPQPSTSWRWQQPTESTP